MENMRSGLELSVFGEHWIDPLLFMGDLQEGADENGL
jgi:hypothetical protein